MSHAEKIIVPKSTTFDVLDIRRNDMDFQVKVSVQFDQVSRRGDKDLHGCGERKLPLRNHFSSDIVEPDQKDLEGLARWMYEARRTRDKAMGTTLFGEPAWDFLLALYCFPSQGEALSVTSLTHAANVPGTTGHRWQQILMKRNLIEREQHGSDGRRQMVRLTQTGKDLMEAYLKRVHRSGMSRGSPSFGSDLG